MDTEPGHNIWWHIWMLLRRWWQTAIDYLWPRSCVWTFCSKYIGISLYETGCGDVARKYPDDLEHKMICPSCNRKIKYLPEEKA